MLKIKRLDLFMLQTFLPLFLMTFFICLFIVMMQFLWMRIDELVGKGLGIDVIAELFFYAALSMVPLALPLAILLASLMTFGNLGEKFELTAMKASGVSLLRTMAPLTILMGLIATGAFFFQNDVIPVAQTKMWTLLFSIRQKSPELEIPEGVFYDQIPGYNIYVESKNRETGVLHDMMIYDVSRGFDNASIILADSGHMSITPDKTHLFLRLWNGESFENLKDASANMRNVPYRRESFDTKEIMLKFDANFNRMDEQGMRNQYVGKNMKELRASIDSITMRVDSMGDSYGRSIRETPYFNLSYYRTVYGDSGPVQVRQADVAMKKPLDIDSVFRGSTSGYALNYLNQALAKAQRMKQEYEYKSFTMVDDQKNIRVHARELHQKFTLSFACIIFFFIGAPLGAIIRKGGIGMPLVISVFLFIFYYIIDSTGKKLAKDGTLEVWEGMWLSSAVLLPLGIFFTYKAVNDSALFNQDAYAAFFRRIFGIKEGRKVSLKEVVMEDVVVSEAVKMLDSLRENCRKYLKENPRHQSYMQYWLTGYDRDSLARLRDEADAVVDYLSNSREKMVILKLKDMPVLRNVWLIRPGNPRWLGMTLACLFPIGLPLWLYGRHMQEELMRDVEGTVRVSNELETLLNHNNTPVNDTPVNK